MGDGLKGGQQLVEEGLKRKPEDDKMPGGLKRIRREDGLAIKDPREPPSDLLHISLRPYLQGYKENLLPVPTLSHSHINSIADSNSWLKGLYYRGQFRFANFALILRQNVTFAV